MPTQIEFSFQALGAGYCFTTPQQLALDITQRISGQLAGDSTLWTKSSSTPSSANQDRPWYKLSGTDQSPVGLYSYWQGQWVRLHPSPAGSSERRLWVGTTTELITHDGGTAGTVTATTGPMWEVDTNFDAKFLVGPGTTANGTEIGVTDTGGEDEHTLIVDELPSHQHGSSGTHDVAGSVLTSGPGAVEHSSPGDDGTPMGLWGASPAAGGGDPHNNLPPYYGVYVIKRTGRIFYVA